MITFGKFFKEKLAHFYVLFLIFLIPIIIIVTSLWRINNYQKNLNTELRQKTGLASSMVANIIGYNLNNKSVLTAQLGAAKSADKQVEDLTVLVLENTNFSVLASTNQEFSDIKLLDSDFLKVWNEQTTLIQEYKNTDVSPSRRDWIGLSPVKDSSGQTAAVLAVKINSADIDEITRQAVNVSLITLVFTVFIVFLLLINHFRFFEYFVNYRKIQEVDKMKDEFISIVSHELKTPIATVKGYMDMILQGLTGKVDEKAKQHLIKILLNIQRLDLLINELLDVSRIEQDRLQYDMQPIDISRVVDEVLTEIGEKATEKGLEIEHKKLSQMPPIFADRDRTAQIIENLVSNAIKYTSKGKITINYQLDKGKLITSIKDTGIGMSPADMKRLFERFYRIKNEKTMDISGTGLGLWIAKAIAKHMNGDIKPESKENIGSTFKIIFPFIKE